ncbi:hypothetical protein JZ751_001026 [Albula glossodonta]|uniref:Tektin n=1 Tax=Albula glossodonta TaxID=121402 RepID=A0A8T2PSC4_9TELE|nr:hypothetical protein JZ751_001026 [Albula glossodonta]
MSKMKDMPPKFSAPEWGPRNPRDFGIPDADRSRSQLVIENSRTLVEESDWAAERMQEDVNKKLEHRIQDIRMWRQELYRKLDEMMQEIELLVIMGTREKQLGIVCDDVERELMKERELTEKVISLLQHSLKQITEQISVPVSLEEWERLTNMNLSSVEQERQNSVNLRAMLESMLEKAATDILRQHKASGTMLQLNIKDNRTAKKQIEDSLAKVQADIESQDRNMESLKAAIEDKKQLLSVVQVQLAARSQRPGIELCQDSAQTQLYAEAQELSAYINRLSEALTRAVMEQRALNQHHLSLGKQIQLKSHAVYIDEAIYGQLCQPNDIYKF